MFSLLYCQNSYSDTRYLSILLTITTETTANIYQFPQKVMFSITYNVHGKIWPIYFCKLQRMLIYPTSPTCNPIKVCRSSSYWCIRTMYLCVNTSENGEAKRRNRKHHHSIRLHTFQYNIFKEIKSQRHPVPVECSFLVIIIIIIKTEGAFHTFAAHFH